MTRESTANCKTDGDGNTTSDLQIPIDRWQILMAQLLPVVCMFSVSSVFSVVRRFARAAAVNHGKNEKDGQALLAMSLSSRLGRWLAVDPFYPSDPWFPSRFQSFGPAVTNVRRAHTWRVLPSSRH